MKTGALLLILCWLILLPHKKAFSEEVKRETLYRLFKEEIESQKSKLKFEILDSSYAEFKFIGGFADGKYRLVAYTVFPLGKGIFKLTLLFEKKRGVFRYRQKVTLYLWQGEREVVFLTKDGKRRFELPEDSIKIVKTKDGYEVMKDFPEKTFVIPIRSGGIYLKVRKKR
jgi:hypothetical protein